MQVLSGRSHSRPLFSLRSGYLLKSMYVRIFTDYTQQISKGLLLGLSEALPLALESEGFISIDHKSQD